MTDNRKAALFFGYVLGLISLCVAGAFFSAY
jgi:hypothetical protein